MDVGQHGAKAVNEILERYGLKTYKSMGQNFLIDTNIPEKMVRLSNIDESCGVLEVGPGLGALTSSLCRVAGRVAAIELDGRLLPLLNETMAGAENVEFMQGDILKLDIADFVKEKMPGLSYRACANLPYNITTPILTAFIDADVFESITVMVQREFARRICAKPGTNDYGAFTVFANYHTEPETLFDVSPESFIPRPNVYSSVVLLKKRNGHILSPDEESMFFRVVRAAFGQRRKTLVNALFAVFGNTLDKDDISEAVRECGFDVRIRGEALGIKEFFELSKKIQLQCIMHNAL